ncbi:TRAP transporter small permease subunit [Xanthobacter sp. 126]|uniref:TRAP transporter small permease subunit n=1 Tax=Xanthobacter sp. 126 TaxID=1131814 RepID=UPI00045EAE58|nr:TRAP transporter small permease subunit [Xanthobacter sp. 126]
MKALLSFSRSIDALNVFVGRVACWAIFVAILVSAANAVVRKMFGVSSNAWLELQWYLFGAVFMLCAPWTLQLNEHIRIDIVASRLSRRVTNLIEVACIVLFLMVFSTLMVWLSVPFVFDSLKSGETSTNAGGLILWPAKALILVGFALLLLQGVSELIKRIAIMRGDLAEAAGADLHEVEAERILHELAKVDPRISEGGMRP